MDRRISIAAPDCAGKRVLADSEARDPARGPRISLEEAEAIRHLPPERLTEPARLIYHITCCQRLALRGPWLTGLRLRLKA